MAQRLPVFRAALFVLALPGAAGGQTVGDDQDPVELDWNPAWDAPFWSEPSGAALELRAGHRPLPVPGAGFDPMRQGETYVLALLNLPFDGATRRSSRGATSAGASSREARSADVDDLASGEREPTEHDADGAASPTPQAKRQKRLGGESLDRAHGEASLPGVPLELLREAVFEAERHGGYDAALRRIQSAGSRARWSGLLPELRLRGVSGIDRMRQLDLTGLVPDEQRTRDGADSLIEARLTFHVERLLFSGEEAALERARSAVSVARAKLEAEIAEQLALFVWAHGVLAQGSGGDEESAADDDRAKRWLVRERARVKLFVLTGGWFQGEPTLRRFLPRDAEPDAHAEPAPPPARPVRGKHGQAEATPPPG